MANNKFLQLFRSSNVYNSKSDAISALKTAFGEHKKDGEPIIARYYTSPDKVAVKTLLGVSYFSGSEGAVVHDTIIDVDAMPSEVQKTIESLIGGASDGYKTLGDLEGKIKAEAERATAAENGLQGAINVINGNESIDGSIAKALKDAKTYADGKVSGETTRAQGQEAAIRSEFAAADTALKTKLLGDAGDNYNTLGKLEDEIQKVASDAKTYRIVAVTENLGTNVKEAWKLVDEDDTQAGATINIYKDSTLKKVELVGQVLQFTYILADGTESTVGVDVSKFLAETEFKNGLAVSDGQVSVKIDETSESFLTVGENGVKISGVQNAINSAIDSLDNNADTAVDGQYVAAINENNGIVSVKTRANVSDAVLTGYVKGADKSAVSSTDDVKGAIAKLENQIADAKSSASQSVADLDAEITSKDSVKVTVKVTQVDGKITAVNVSESDIASAQGLAAEIAAREAADNAINNKINAMDFTDAVNKGEYVYSVNQTDGKIAVAHKALIAAAANGNSNDMLSTDSNGSIVLSNVFDMGTY